MPVDFNVDAVMAGIEKLQGIEKPVAAPRGSPRLQKRMYANAIPSRLNQGFPSYNSSADSELVTSLRNLRSRSRMLVRDAPYAKRAKRLIQNNVVGTGVRLQSTVLNARNTLNERVNTGIECAFKHWMHAPRCHTGGELHFHDFERQLLGQVFEAGEVFVRMHRSKFGDSEVPLALELIEAERLVEGYASPAVGTIPGNVQIRMGIEVDNFRRPVAYWIRDLHPGDVRMDVERTDSVERVPASDIFHLRVIDRWPQTRGEPWLHAAAGKLQDMNGYSEAEIIGARAAANYLMTIESPESPDAMADQQPDGDYQMGLEPGSVMRITPGEKATFISPNRPNSALDPFMRYMLREVAAGIDVSYEGLSMDYGQGNYSSMRIAMLTDRDVWRALQQWYIRTFRHRLHLEWLQAAVLAKAIPEVEPQQYALDIKKFSAAIMRPRGWSWIDPTKEVAAYQAAVKAGFTTVAAVIQQTGAGDDLEDILVARADELETMKELKLAFDTSPEVYVPAESRGQMIVNEDGDVIPAAEAEAAATAFPEPGPAKPPVDDKTDKEGGRGIRRILRLVRGYSV